ncbi:CPBP family intramembrane metalloprotease [Lysinibacillus agricola]|uniref:CPBP family intramembrane metalloprotease n=1 Tax=Lysinibacillus agricola TaxID=2590012 RepID=A0ABX7AWZ5_9BACI|nr:MULTISPECIES: type II CAAX endopeptidase family protein [Lysinibacillus]KOS62498.1 CAAX protease [Lysinibacillus sp. FJAT-14222]QQP13398.1 CPBP family intramembrane metalloprotease [Lysinibacillus agricola]
MLTNSKQTIIFLLSLLFVYGMLAFTFANQAVFWYMYAFTLLVCIAIAILAGKIEDQLPTWQFLLFGIGYGTITYGIIRFGYWLAPHINNSLVQSVQKFLANYGPQNIWHYILLVFIVAIGEELFWRGYIQQQLKRFMRPAFAVIVTAMLCAISIAISGFMLGMIAALVTSLIWGFLYEWRKSMPLVIVTHVVFVLLLFLVLPLT